jgi:phosphate transport system permease protein
MPPERRPGDAVRRAGLSRRGTRSAGERAIGALLFACAAVSVATTLAVVAVLAGETFAFFAHPDVGLREFLTGREWTPLFPEGQRAFGIAPLVLGTLLVTAVALAVGLPLGLLAAIHLSEFASPAARRRIVPVLEVLAGIPTVVLGYFALQAVTPFLRTFVPDLDLFNPLSAGLVMGFMILPTVTSISLDAMRAVPDALREAAYGLGAGKSEVVVKIVVPAALSGIVASFILAMSRAIGETMIVTLAAGQKPTFTLDVRETIATMTSFIVQAATGDQPAGSLASRSLYAVGATLFLITLVLNLISQRVVRRFGERYE